MSGYESKAFLSAVDIILTKWKPSDQALCLYRGRSDRAKSGTHIGGVGGYPPNREGLGKNARRIYISRLRGQHTLTKNSKNYHEDEVVHPCHANLSIIRHEEEETLRGGRRRTKTQGNE